MKNLLITEEERKQILSKHKRHIIKEQDELEDDTVTLNPVKPILQDTLIKVKEIENCGCGDYEQRKRLYDLFMDKMEAISTLPDKMPILPPKEIENDLDMDIEY